MITASLVQQLRAKTGAGLMDCKKALLETAGDITKAVDFLRTKGLSAAAKKADRVAAEGLTCISVADRMCALIELNAETDFVARNEQFQNLARKIATLALKFQDIESLKSAQVDGCSVSDLIIQNIATIGENINLRRVGALHVTRGIVAHYVHNAVADCLGKISVAVALESDAKDQVKLMDIGHKIAVHVAANSPASIDIASLDQKLVENERNIFMAQAESSGKPQEIIEKMVQGRIRKLYEEVVLLEQKFLFDDKVKISEIISSSEKELGASIKLTGFLRYAVGDGIEQEQKKNFAEEVAAVIG